MRLGGLALLAVTALLVSSAQAATSAPVFDNSGNAKLTGTWVFRQVAWFAGTPGGALTDELALNGSFVFDGAGHYTISSGTLLDYNAGSYTVSTPIAGSYTLSASGYGYLSSPISHGDTVYFLLANGVLTGSATESGLNDLLIAAQVSTPAPNIATFQGSWSMAGFLPGLTPTGSADVFFSVTPDGAGNLGAVTVSGYSAATGATLQAQNSTGVSYSFSGGAASVVFPTVASAPFYQGAVTLNFSPDGNFAFGGSAAGFDMLVGVRNGTAPGFSGLYYQAGAAQDFSQYAASAVAGFNTYYGSLKAGGGVVHGHQRVNSLANPGAVGSTYADTYPATITGAYSDTAANMQFAWSGGGAYRIGAATWPYLGLNVAVQAPSFSGAGVFLDPTGVVNAASFAPFTAGISNGELILLYGTGLAGGSAQASTLPLPGTLGGVQVTVNGLPAPLIYVTPGTVAAVVPYHNSYPVAQIQLTNNGKTSNVVTSFVYNTTPGVFTTGQNGVGYGALVHGNGTAITAASPALPNETIETYVSGLGVVYPGVSDGAAAPVSPLSYALNTFTTMVGGVAANATYAGLAPYEAGLYQVNITIPGTTAAGPALFEIDGPDSATALAQIPVGVAPPGSARQPAAVPGRQTTRAIRPGAQQKWIPGSITGLTKQASDALPER